MFAAPITQSARALIESCRGRALRIVTAESCTGGLVGAALTAIPGASDVLERGFVTYSNQAKTEMLGVTTALLAEHGAVSKEVALAMADGALQRSRCDIAIAVTGVAGPAGGSAAKPIGLVHVAIARRGRASTHEEWRFGDMGRDGVREESVRVALELAARVVG
jgi:nicotinamide-nucleotide amidase